MIPIYNPNIFLYKSSAINAITSGWISNHGEYIEKSTELFKKMFDIKNVILMNNGTCATHCLFIALKYKYPTIQKIYIPNNAYVAAWNSCFMEYDKTHVEVMKMDITTWNINTDEEYIKTLSPNSAVLIVHNLGNIINVPRLKRIRPDLIFLEDNCEGFTGKYENIYSGMSTSSLCSSVSFYGNKIITTGEGGAFCTNDDELYHYMKKVYSQGMSSIRYLHDTHAYNYRMSNIQAAFLYDQLTDFHTIISTKKSVFNRYKKLFEPLIKINKISFFHTEDYTECANWIFAVRIIDNNLSIEQLNNFFNKQQIDIRPFFYPITSHHHLSDIPSSDPNSILLNREIIMIPSSPTITFEEQKQVVESFFNLFLNNIKTVHINNNNTPLLEEFVKKIENKHFRYYNSRNIDVIKNHLATILLQKDNISIGYAHIDLDILDNKHWVGIYLVPEYRNKGIGKLLLAYLLFIGKYYNIQELHLSVDIDNANAIALYKKIGFTPIKESHIIVMKYTLS